SIPQQVNCERSNNQADCIHGLPQPGTLQSHPRDIPTVVSACKVASKLSQVKQQVELSAQQDHDSETRHLTARELQPKCLEVVATSCQLLFQLSFELLQRNRLRVATGHGAENVRIVSVGDIGKFLLWRSFGGRPPLIVPFPPRCM